MTDPSSMSSDPETQVDRPRPEELPPVEPPSASYIVQLFLIPALIVAAVIGVWALFGKLAESETNWEQSVTEIGSTNVNRRWRAALGLAQILRNQEISKSAEEVAVADQPLAAKALAQLLTDSLKIKSPEDPDEEAQNREFLARTLGAFRVDDVVLPVLADALTADRDASVRKSSLMALAMIAGRHFEARSKDAELLEPDREYNEGEAVVTLREPLSKPTISNAAVWEQITVGAQDEDPAVRHLAVFVMALVSGPEAMEQLKVALLDRDSLARANAAVGLARNGLTDGVEVLIELLQDGSETITKVDFQALTAEEQQEELKKRQFEQPVILGNSLRAIDSIWILIEDDDRKTLKPLIRKIADDNAAANIRLQASKLSKRFDESETTQ